MKIVFYENPGGSLWADYEANGRKIVKSIEAHTRAEIEALIASPGKDAPLRVKALAERALKELLARDQQPEPTIQLSPPITTLRKRGFLGRLKYLFTGE